MRMFESLSAVHDMFSLLLLLVFFCQICVYVYASLQSNFQLISYKTKITSKSKIYFLLSFDRGVVVANQSFNSMNSNLAEKRIIIIKFDLIHVTYNNNNNKDRLSSFNSNMWSDEIELD